MHACGHDVHVAMLAAAARLLTSYRDQLVGSVKFVFQPGEEGFGGAAAVGVRPECGGGMGRVMKLALEKLAAGAGGKVVSQAAKRRLAGAAKRLRSEAQPSGAEPNSPDCGPHMTAHPRSGSWQNASTRT